MTKNEINRLSKEILNSAIIVHKEMGPGLLESVYEYCLISELRKRDIKVESQVCLPLLYKDVKLSKEFSNRSYG